MRRRRRRDVAAGTSRGGWAAAASAHAGADAPVARSPAASRRRRGRLRRPPRSGEAATSARPLVEKRERVGGDHPRGDTPGRNDRVPARPARLRPAPRAPARAHGLQRARPRRPGATTGVRRPRPRAVRPPRRSENGGASRLRRHGGWPAAGRGSKSGAADLGRVAAHGADATAGGRAQNGNKRVCGRRHRRSAARRQGDGRRAASCRRGGGNREQRRARRARRRLRAAEAARARRAEGTRRRESHMCAGSSIYRDAEHARADRGELGGAGLRRPGARRSRTHGAGTS